MVVAVAALSALSAIAISTVRTTAFDVEMAWSQVAADMRTARARAVNHGDHYRVVVTSARSYAIQPMRLDPGTGSWLPDAARQVTTTFPDSVAWVTAVDTAIEFDTRGTGVGLTDAITFALGPAGGGGVRLVSVWPSGQVLRR